MSTSPQDRSLLILFSVIVLDLIGFGVVVPILPFYAKQYGASGTLLGLLLTSYSAMQFLCAPLWGKLSDRIGRRSVIVLTMGGSCLSLVLVGIADSLLVIFIGRILSGVFAANVSVASAYVADVTTEENRAKGMGLIGAAFGVGFILGPAIGGFLSRYGYHVPILTAAVLTALNMMYAALRLTEPIRHQPVEGMLEPSLLSQKKLLKFCLIYFVFTLSVTQLESVFALYMMDRFAYDAIHVASLLALMAVIMVAIQGGFIKSLTRKFGENWLLLSGAILLSGSFLLIPWAAKVSFLLLPLMFSSIGRGVSQPSLLSLVSREALPHRRGTIMGTFQSSASLGRVIGPAVAGLLYDHWQVVPFYVAAALMAVVFLMSLGL